LEKVCNGKQPQVINREVGNEIKLLCSVEDWFTYNILEIEKVKSLVEFNETSWKLEAFSKLP